MELDFGFVVILKVVADALVDTEAFLEETLEDIETFFEDTDALMEETFDETDAFLEDTLDETEAFWVALDETEGLCEIEALVEVALTEALEETETFLEETLADTELFFDETEALIEETLEETDAFFEETEGLGSTLEETEGLGPALEDTDITELWLVEELIIEAAIEGLRVDDAVMVLFMPTLILISMEHDYVMVQTYMGAFMGRPAAFICSLARA